MFRSIIFIFLFVISLHGQISAQKTDKPDVMPHPNIPTTTEAPPNTTTTAKPDTTIPTTKPPTPPTTPPTTTTPNTTTPTTTTPSTTTSKPTPTPSPSPTPSPTTTTTKKPTAPPTPAPTPQPSDRKFDAFSFLGGFCLALGLVAIVILAWKFYVSRQENVYHTL